MPTIASSQGLKLGARNSIRVSHMGGRNQLNWAILTASQGLHYQEGGVRIRGWSPGTPLWDKGIWTTLNACLTRGTFDESNIVSIIIRKQNLTNCGPDTRDKKSKENIIENDAGHCNEEMDSNIGERIDFEDVNKVDIVFKWELNNAIRCLL